MAETRRITLNRNGIKSHGFMVLVPDTLEELLRLSSEKLQFEAAYLFSEQGALIDDIRLIRDNDVFYVAADGEGFVELNPRAVTDESGGVKRKSEHLDASADDEQVKLFIGSLSKNLSEEDLRKLFAEYGTIIEVKMLTDKLTGKSKGAAFVRYSSRQAGDRAIQSRNGQMLPGAVRPMTVKYAEGDMGAEAGEYKLFVGSLPKTITEQELRDVFTQYGTPTEVILLRSNQQSKGSGAFVKYKYKKEALQAINSGHGQVVQGQPIVVRFADQKQSHSSQMMLGNFAMSSGAPPFARMQQMNLGNAAAQGHAPFCPAQYGYHICTCGMSAATISQPPNKRGGFQMNQPQIPQGQQIQAIQQAQQLQALQQQQAYQQQFAAQQQQQAQQPPQAPGPYQGY